MNLSNHKTKALARAIAGGLLLMTLSACGGRDTSEVPVPVGAPSATALTGGAGNGSTNVSPANSGPTVKMQIAMIERDGAYPALDRSTDIAGPDANVNGVRDDIETWIDGRAALSKAQRMALMQKAKSLQQTLVVDLQDPSALQKAGDGLAASSNCGIIQFSPYATFSKLSGKIESMTANTRERAARYNQYNAARSGSSTTLPDGDTCER